ncbi:MAG TPA: PrsW family glutamic-type intramembrane protease [Saprospiraceae bacterium]|nr:PrsW family glutamic-type intramembrane protease [Saprospiraceae bacterium]
MNPLLLILATLPGLLLSYAIFRADKYEREPLVPLLVCFALGAAITFPALEIEKWAFHRARPYEKGFWVVALTAFIAVAFNEEVFKFLVLRLFAFPRQFFNEPLDGIVYSVMIAMGFATMENISFANRFGLETVLLRAFTAVPAHLVFGVVAGYYAGLAKFDPANRRRLLWQGFGIAFLFHGVYDFLIMQNWSDWLPVLATVSLYLCLFYCNDLIKEHLDKSPFRRSDV